MDHVLINCRKRLKKKVTRYLPLGLDPAMPLFVTSNLERKLDSSDAIFVDVLHTNALFKGKLEPSGHVDFYANGGLTQPGCIQDDNQSNCLIYMILVHLQQKLNLDFIKPRFSPNEIIKIQKSTNKNLAFCSAKCRFN